MFAKVAWMAMVAGVLLDKSADVGGTQKAFTRGNDWLQDEMLYSGIWYIGGAHSPAISRPDKSADQSHSPPRVVLVEPRVLPADRHGGRFAKHRSKHPWNFVICDWRKEVCCVELEGRRVEQLLHPVATCHTHHPSCIEFIRII